MTLLTTSERVFPRVGNPLFERSVTPVPKTRLYSQASSSGFGVKVTTFPERLKLPVAVMLFFTTLI
jgi:hypothetical protein